MDSKEKTYKATEKISLSNQPEKQTEIQKEQEGISEPPKNVTQNTQENSSQEPKKIGTAPFEIIKE